MLKSLAYFDGSVDRKEDGSSLTNAVISYHREIVCLKNKHGDDAEELTCSAN